MPFFKKTSLHRVFGFVLQVEPQKRGSDVCVAIGSALHLRLDVLPLTVCFLRSHAGKVPLFSSSSAGNVWSRSQGMAWLGAAPGWA